MTSIRAVQSGSGVILYFMGKRFILVTATVEVI